MGEQNTQARDAQGDGGREWADERGQCGSSVALWARTQGHWPRRRMPHTVTLWHMVGTWWPQERHLEISEPYLKDRLDPKTGSAESRRLRNSLCSSTRKTGFPPAGSIQGRSTGHIHRVFLKEGDMFSFDLKIKTEGEDVSSRSSAAGQHTEFSEVTKREMQLKAEASSAG